MSILKSPRMKCLDWLSLAKKLRPEGLCYLCQQPSGHSVCGVCEQDCLFFNNQAINYNLLNWPSIKQGVTPGKYRQLIALSYFHWPLNHLIRRFKYGHPNLSVLLAEWFLRYTCVTNRPLPDCLLPVPISPWRYAQRQYHQTLLLALHYGKYLNIPVVQDWAHRQGWQSSQQKLGRKARLENLKHAYRPGKHTFPQRVAIIDDVVTTGSTIATLSRMIHQHSPQTEISVWALAITPARMDSQLLLSGYQLNARE